MYNATLGMLWSVCTSTFIPFLSVFVATGNSCPIAVIAQSAHTHKNAKAAFRNQDTVFMNPPSQETNRKCPIFFVEAQHRCAPAWRRLNVLNPAFFFLAGPLPCSVFRYFLALFC